MANADFTSTANQHETKGAKAIFEPFTWGHRSVDKPGVELPGNGLMGLARGVKDIAAGVALILDIAHFDSVRQEENDSEEASLIRDGDHWVLQRLAIASLKLLEANADRLMDWAYEYRTPEGQQERRAQEDAVRRAMGTAVEKQASDALCKLSSTHGREAVVAVLSQFGVKNMGEMQPVNYEKVVAACAKYETH